MANSQMKITGPLWKATVDVLELKDPQRHHAWRTLFLERTPYRSTDWLLPGAMLLLCRPRKVIIRLGSGSSRKFEWKRSGSSTISVADEAEMDQKLDTGEWALLLVNVDPEAGDWQRFRVPPAQCLAGDIVVDKLEPKKKPKPDAQQALYSALSLTRNEEAIQTLRDGAAGLAGEITVHASGVSLLASFTLPWHDEMLTAPLWLHRPLNDSHEPEPFMRLSLERERLTGGETQALILAWQRLGRALTPSHGLFSSQAGDDDEPDVPQWTTLELTNPLAVPHLYWQIDNQEPPSPQLRFSKGDFNLLLSDRQPFDQKDPPTSIARIVPTVSVSVDDATLGLAVKSGVEGSESGLSYRWRSGSEGTREEKIIVNPTTLRFDPVSTARTLRRAQALPEPEWPQRIINAPETIHDPADPAVLWAFMPLADGWAQLPVPNLSEQIYLDMDVAQVDETPQEKTVVIQGAVTFDNDDNRTRRQPAEEQPWSLTLVDAATVMGNWEIDLSDGEKPRITAVDLTCHAPQFTVNGLFWLSTGQPTTADALPTLDDWVAGLISVPLQTPDPQGDMFPAPVSLALTAFSFRQRSGGSAQLDPWRWFYQPQANVITQLNVPGFGTDEEEELLSALVWRRHRTLPMVQALPLTQSQKPPNVPSSSRQLIPFTLPLSADDALVGWEFGVLTTAGASAWPECLTPAPVADEWGQYSELPLVSLSLPGLVLLPDGALPDQGDMLGLDWQWRFDLPYLDESNALAQLPKTNPDPADESVLKPAERPPKPDEVWTRSRYAQQWRRLAELAALAEADAVDAFKKENGNTFMQHLVAPYVWPVDAQAHMSTYPGSLTLNGEGVQEEAALRGIDGRFQPNLDPGHENELMRLPDEDDDDSSDINFANLDSDEDDDEDDDNNPFKIVAGSMTAHRDRNGLFHDQRGLARESSQKNGGLLTTPLHYHEEGEVLQIALASLLRPIELDAAGKKWNFWFRDLPLQAGQFSRAELPVDEDDAGSDINDADALAVNNNFRRGYEWRLGDSGQYDAPLLLYGLHFYPLRLEQVETTANKVSRVILAGRLQLPLPGHDAELEDLSNVVLVTFALDVAAKELVIDDVVLQEAAVTSGDWPLALAGSERMDAPRLLWDGAELVYDTLDNFLAIKNAHVQFHLLGAAWVLPLGDLKFAQQTASSPYKYPRASSHGGAGQVAFRQVAVILDMGNHKHTIDLTLSVRLGRREALDTGETGTRSALAADVLANFDAEEQKWTLSAGTTCLFDDILLQTATNDDDPNVSLHYQDNSFQFRWEKAESEPDTALQLLPGMHLAGLTREAPGFAALTFAPQGLVADPPEKSDLTVLPTFGLEAAFVEAVLLARWGDEAWNWASSSGDIALGYAATWQPANHPSDWDETFLLNGFLTVQNLISWPADLQRNGDDWTFPGLVDGAELAQWRHRTRILLNQQALPADLLVMEPGDLLFNLAGNQSWQFPAIVEHHLRHLQEPGADNESVIAERRWTAVQEIRLTTPGGFRDFLQMADDRKTISSSAGPIIDSSENKIRSNHRQIELHLSPLPDENRFNFDHNQLNVAVEEKRGNEWGQMAQGWERGGLGRLEEEDDQWVGIKNYTVGADRDDTREYRWVVYRDFDSEWRPILISKPFKLPPRDRDKLQIRIEFPQPNRLDGISLKFEGVRQAFNGYYEERLADWLDDAAADLPHDMLLVEASGHFWLNRRHTAESKATVLQYLPTVTQKAVLSDPDDYEPSHPHDPQWLLLTMPFLGRLQDGARDEDANLENGLQVDPLLLARRANGDRNLALHLAHRQAATLSIPPIDGLRGRVFARLDPLSLQENWLRFQQQLPEGLPTHIVSMMAALPDTPARLSRATTLQRALDAVRRDHLPPEMQLAAGDLLWRPSSLIALPEARHQGAAAVPLPGWPLTAILLQSDPLGPDPSDPVGNPFSHHAAATLLPAPPPADKEVPPISMAVSPYLSLAAAAAPLQDDQLDLRFVSSELIALTGRSGRFSPIASRMWERRLFAVAMPDEDDNVSIKTAVSDPLGERDLTLSNSATVTTVESGLLWEIKDGARQFEIRKDGTKLAVCWPVELLSRMIRGWADDTRLRLQPHSAVTVLRERSLWENVNPQRADEEEAVLIARYRFTLLQENKTVSLGGRRAFPLRAPVSHLHFREGQFGGSEMPPPELRHFELAPPQMTGVQPLYAVERPDAEEYLFSVDSHAEVIDDLDRGTLPRALLTEFENEGKSLADEANVTVQKAGISWVIDYGGTQYFIRNENQLLNVYVEKIITWPWGLSALRYSVAYTDKNEGVLGVVPGVPSQNGMTLWWQAPQHRVQFRPINDGTASFQLGLPPLFRARAISSYLPVLPRLPLPEVDAEQLLEAKAADVKRWQPILPGGLHYWLLGMRPGVMLAMRHQLIRQSLARNGAVTSGSVPVQHRTPRPVPLPANDGQRSEIALRTWASQFEAQKTLHFDQTPVDEAFLAAYFTENDEFSEPAHRLQLTLRHPQRGMITPEWDRHIMFTAAVDGERNSTSLGKWQLEVKLIVDGITFPCVVDGDSMRFMINDADSDTIKLLEERLSALRPGDTMPLQVLAWRDPDPANKGFRQVLTFLLRVGDEKAHKLPLQPTFIHFEDPEYNRRLATKAVQAVGALQLEQGGSKVSHPVTLAVDRREYNADGRMALRYDWTGSATPPSGVTSTFEFKRVDTAGDERLLAGVNRDGTEAGGLVQIPLLDLKEDGLAVKFNNGDTLKMSMTLRKPNAGSETLSLMVDIVEEPVIPVPEAAYALLRWQKVLVSGDLMDEQVQGDVMDPQVQCVRFAWGPAASRIELVCADDLRTGLVRRRAVFQWRDAVRPPAQGRDPIQYAVQKITQTGSTHFPSFPPNLDNSTSTAGNSEHKVG